jgi:hypothetical protein
MRPLARPRTTQEQEQERIMSAYRRSVMLHLAGLAALLASSACDGGVGVDGPQNVALNFRVAGGGGAQIAAGSAPAGSPARVAGPPMTIVGSNGTLTIDEVRLIVAEVELKGEDDSCELAAQGADDCADFEAPPRFFDLPLDGAPVQAFVGLIAPGTYKELEFEIEDLEDDETDEAFAQEIAALRADILAEFPDWPRKASALVVGTFEGPTGATSFRVYIDAEIEIERDLIPNLVVAEDGGAATDLTVDIRLDRWFMLADGSVLELPLYDFDATDELLELEFEIENGFMEIEIEGRG